MKCLLSLFPLDELAICLPAIRRPWGGPCFLSLALANMTTNQLSRHFIKCLYYVLSSVLVQHVGMGFSTWSCWGVFVFVLAQTVVMI